MTWLRSKVQRMKRLRRARRMGRAATAGMTLLEIMIVLAIIGIITSAIGVGLFSRYKAALLKTAKSASNSVQTAVELYMIDHSHNCPASLQDLVNDAKLEKKQAKDPWGQDWILKCPGQANPTGVDVISAGPDKQEGTADDIKAWE